MLARLKIRQLRLLVAVGSHRSVLHAALSLNMSQPAATKLLKDLEEDLGVTLFERTNRGVVPTIFGAALMRNARMILSQIGQAVLEIDDLARGREGRVVVGTLIAASAEVLPRAIADVLENRPGLAVKIVEGTNEALIPGLRTGDLDLVVGRLPVFRHRDEVAQERLYEAESLALVRPGHPLAARRGLGLEELRGWGFVLPPPETTLRRQLDQMFQHAGGPPPVPLESVAWLANRRLLAETDLVGILPAQVAADELSVGRLVALDLSFALPRGAVGVCYSTRRGLSPAADFFLQALRRAGADVGRAQISPSVSTGA
ncbi:MAG: LysR family transcriptional regulator [Rhodobacteraceae bacterium]|nr:LysR family transcriptional regulator [Paracoccaceae bacterium]